MVMILAKHFKEERKKRNLKQDQLSQTLNVSRQVISE